MEAVPTMDAVPVEGDLSPPSVDKIYMQSHFGYEGTMHMDEPNDSTP
jgi:hypothetical protein